MVPERTVTTRTLEPAWKKRWDAARALVRAGRAEAAIAVYDEVLRLKPDLEDASWELAQVLLQVGQKSRAMSLLETLHENNPGRKRYSLAFARLLVKEGKFDRAKPLFEELLAKEGDTPEVLQGLITVLRQKDDKKHLLDVARRYQRLRPDDRQVRLLLAKTAFALNRLELARKNIIPLAEDAAATPEVLRLAAKIYDRLGLSNPAIHFWHQVVRKIPRDKEANIVLANYYAKQPGKEQIALSYFLAIKDQKPLPDKYAYEVGALLAKLGRWHEAIAYLEEYFRQHPDSQRTLRLLISAHAAVGDKEKTLALLEKYFARAERPDPQKLRQAADLYDAAGRYHEAIPLYRKLLDLTPNDPELLEVLARDLLLIGEDEGSLKMWKLLSRISPQRLDVHYSMAALLQKLGRDKELVKVLLGLRAMAPADLSIPLRLAEAYRRLGDRQNCAKVLRGLLKRPFSDPGSLERRAVLCQYLGWYGHALRDYLAVLAAGTKNKAALLQNVRLAALRCAGETGQYGVLTKLSKELADKRPRFRLALARAYDEAGAFWQAEDLYLQLLSPDKAQAPTSLPGEAQRLKVLNRLFSLYGDQKRVFAQEETLRRLALHKGREKVAFARLAELAARNGQLVTADAWLSRVVPRWRHQRMEDLLTNGPLLFAAGVRAKCTILLAEGRLKEARASVAALLRTASRQERAGLDKQARFNLLASLVRLFSDAGRSRESGVLIRAAALCQVTQRQAIVLAVIRAREARKNGNMSRMRKALENAAVLAEDDSSLRLFYVRTLQQARLFNLAAKPAAGLPRLLPDSLAAHLLAALNLKATGQLQEALQEAQRTAAIFPAASEPRWLAMQLLYRQGHFNDALALYAGFDAKLQQRPDVLLLRIRAVWSSGRHEQAIAAYRSFLKPAAAAQYKAKTPAANLAGKQRTGNWLFSLLGRKEPSLLEQRLAPGNFRQGDAAAAQLSARFHWQQKYRQELAARNSVERFEFYHAARLYKSILAKERVPDLAMLFDLGGIYSRLERPGEEAAVYEQIAAAVPDYPGLAAAMAQNSLKRRPRTGIYYTFRREEGRKDKKSIDRQAVGVSSWVSLAPRQEVKLEAERIHYRSTLAAGGQQWSKLVKAMYSTSFLNKITASFGAGVERLDHIGNDVPLLDCRLDGEMGDAFSWYLSFATDLTADTIQSVQQHIRRQSYALGSSLDLLPRLQIGADYLVDSFSDGNTTEGYNLRAAYLLLTEPNVLALRYDYEFKDSKDSSYPKFFLGGVSSNPNHPYYTPHNYWLNNFGLYFKHLMSNEKFGRGIPSYFEASFSLGHDSDGYAVQTLQAGFFSQYNSHFLIRASADITTSETYRSKGALLSFQYRW